MRWLLTIGLFGALFYPSGAESQQPSRETISILMEILVDQVAPYENIVCLKDQYGEDCGIYFETTEPVRWYSRACCGNKTPVFLETPGMVWRIRCGMTHVEGPRNCCLYGDQQDLKTLAVCIQDNGISFFERSQTMDVELREIRNE